jgi:tetratricopeptide (TPR) repeat protein
LKNARQQLTQPGEGQLLAPLAEVLLNTHSGQVVDMLASVRSLGKSGKTHSAMEEAYYALQFAPIYLPLHIQIGELLLQDGLLPEAIQKFMVVARVYNVRGEVTQAAQLLRRVIQLTPMDLGVRTQLIDLLVSQEQTEEGIREYIDLADIYYRQGDFKPARQTFLDALRLAQKLTADHSWSVQILKRMADIDMQRMEWRQAMRVLEQIRTMQPGDEKTRSSLIDLNIRMGQDSAALNELDSFRSYLESNGQQDQAIQFIKTVLNDHPDKIELHKRLADMYRQANRIPEAIAELDIIGDQLLGSGNRAAAAVVVQAIINMNPPNVAEYQQMLKQIQSQA